LAVEREAKDNIPFRILLSLLDEVFQLDQNKWLRRSIVPVLSGFITSMFGKGINRQIVDSIEYSVSLEQVASYIIQLRDACWPDGVLAAPSVPRSAVCSHVIQIARMVTRCSNP
jgi:hypothetical protein